MPKTKLHRSIVLIIFIMLVFSHQTVVDAQVVCDKFKLITELKKSILDLSIDTDLPDNTGISVSVSRSYLEKGTPAIYSVDYLSESSTVGKWKSRQRITINNKKWKSDLKAKQKEMSRFGLGFDVASISDKITVRIVVPIVQPDPRFGKENSNLTGKAVRKSGLRVVEAEVEIAYPLDSPLIGKSPFPSLDPLKLEFGPIYIVSKETPLAPHHSPDDPMKAIQQMKQIPNGGKFKVVGKKEIRHILWYKVIAYDQNKRRIGSGWINSIALLSQKLEVEK